MTTPIRSGGQERSQPAETTLLHARQLATTAGISEVRDITGLDVLGVPVFVSVRPQALANKFTFGKGLRPIDAEVGAYMEAIEFFFAEPGNSNVATHWGTVRDVARQAKSNDAILNFVPLLQCEVNLDGPLLLATASDIESGEECSIPAELVYFPAPKDIGQSLFGKSTNGVASGNSVIESTIQGLLELIERDIWSFHSVFGASSLVEPGTMPDEVREIVERAERNGLQLKVRYVPNDFGVPFFSAFLFDPKVFTRRTFNGGWACDLNAERALMKAVTEAAQSRVAFMHGGRRVRRVESKSRDAKEREKNLVQVQMRKVSEARSSISMTEIPDLEFAGTLEQKLQTIIVRLREVVTEPIYRVVFTATDSPLQAVRVVVPLLENIHSKRPRIGPRLKHYLGSLDHLTAIAS